MPEPREFFPGLALVAHQITSPQDSQYNCIAWAANDTSRWWEPVAWISPGMGQIPLSPYYWPSGLPLGDYSTANYVRAFETIGYEVCASGELDSDHEKIAIYSKDGRGSHAARQRVDGVWLSKLGRNVDIEHATPEALEGDQYGQVEILMQRPSS